MTRTRNDGLRKVCGCSRRSWPKCAHPWHFNFKWQGTPYRFSLDRQLGERVESKADAREAADKIRTAIRDGTFNPQAKSVAAVTPGAITFQGLADLWLERANRTGRDRTYVRSLARMVAATGEPLGEKAIGAITEDDLERVFEQLRARKLAASTRNHHLQTGSRT